MCLTIARSRSVRSKPHTCWWLFPSFLRKKQICFFLEVLSGEGCGPSALYPLAMARSSGSKGHARVMTFIFGWGLLSPVGPVGSQYWHRCEGLAHDCCRFLFLFVGFWEGTLLGVSLLQVSLPRKVYLSFRWFPLTLFLNYCLLGTKSLVFSWDLLTSWPYWTKSLYPLFSTWVLLTLKAKLPVILPAKDGFIWERHRIAIWDKQTIAKP